MKILLGITGSIAAYKSAELVRKLKEKGHDVRVVMTRAAEAFITPLTLATLSQYPVATELFSLEKPMLHIELAKWAELILIAPASANRLSMLAQGAANDLLNAICLATAAPIWLVPAMNQAMWQHPATQYHLQQLKNFAYHLLPTDLGEQACGDIGPGRMLEPEDLVARVQAHFAPKKIFHERVVITAGPTQEAIDPVRYLTNYGSGKMGYALAQAFSESGAEVILISGPTNLPEPKVHKLIAVKTAEDMYDAVMKEIKSAKIFIATASVADYRVKTSSHQKIKKTSASFTLELVRNRDILAAVGKLKKKPFIVGFAAETENLLKHAAEKMRKKACDMLVANQVTAHGPFGKDENAVTILRPKQKALKLPTQSKQQLALTLVDLILKEWPETRFNA